MSKYYFFLLCAATLIPSVRAAEVENVKPVKNIILCIPDGTSLATISMARWLQFYRDSSKPNLFIDPYICGTVRTTSSNAPIGDSAPTTSCYMTGHPSRTGYISTYPPADGRNDIYPMDTALAYRPMVTLLEAAKMLQGKSVGLAFTCQFPHATPADCSAHYYDRNKYAILASQMAHNDLSVVVGGGTSYLTPDIESYLKTSGVKLYKDDLAGMRADKSDKMWALFGSVDIAYDIDRDTTRQPSLEEMTRIAIEKLSKNPKGFFLMVEGSKVDWAAHINDPAGMASEMLSYDRACHAAIEFARRDGNTAVIMVPDHGNSGISIGRNGCGPYDKLTKDQLFAQFSKYTRSADGMMDLLNTTSNDSVRYLFSTYEGLNLSNDEITALNNCKDYKRSPIPAADRKENAVAAIPSGDLEGFLCRLLTRHTCFGFTHLGHTGEEVFLAAYHPQGSLPIGMHTNVELNHYLCSLFGLNGALDTLSASIFAPHTEVFRGYECKLIPAVKGQLAPTLVVRNPKNKKKLTISPYTNTVILGKNTPIRLSSVVVYVDKKNTFYLPKSLEERIR